MAKKYLTAKERSKRNRIILISALAVAVVSAAAITLGAIFGSRPADLRGKMEKAAEDGAQDKKGAAWMVYEALMAIEDEGTRTGSNGIEYDRSAGNTLCFDLSAFESADLPSIEKMLKDYCSLKDMKFRTGTMAQLKGEGLILSNGQPDVYSEGCLISFDPFIYDEEERSYATEVFFYYNSRYGRSARLKLVRAEDWSYFKDEYGANTGDAYYEDGAWVVCVYPGFIT